MTTRRNKPRSANDKGFLWVNKDEASFSLSSSDPSEARRIFQFVQRQRLGTNTSDPSTVDTNISISPSRKTNRPRHRPLSVRLNTTTSEAPIIDEQPSAHESREGLTAEEGPHRASSRHIHDWIAHVRRTRQNVPANNFIPSSGVDPFSATPIPITKDIEVLIKYFNLMSTTGSHVDKAEVLPPHLQPVRRYTSFRDVTLNKILKDKVEFASLMVVMASRMVHLSRIPAVGFARPEYYMHLAISSIQERMVDCQRRGVQGDRVIANGVHSLAVADWISQRFAAAATHVRAMRLLMQFLDMENNVDILIAKGIVNIDKMIAIETGWLPVFPVMFDPGPMESKRMSLIKAEIKTYRSSGLVPVLYPRSPVLDASNATNAVMSHVTDILANASEIMDLELGSGFEQAILARVIHPALSSVLSDFLDVVTVAKYVWRTPHATKDDAEWMCSRARAINHRLLALPKLMPEPAFSTEARKAEALRIALVLIMLRCTNRMAFRSAQPNMRRLQRVLEGIDTNWRSSPGSNSQENTASVASSPLSTSKLSSRRPAVNASPEESARAASPPLMTSAPSQRPALISESSSSSSSSYDENRLLLWILLTGHFNAHGEPEEMWFLMRAAYVAEHHLGFHDAEHLHSFMGQYLYSKTMQHHSLTVVGLYLSSV